MNTTSNSLKIYQVSFLDKVKIVLENYEFGMPIIESLADAKFTTLNKFADNLVYMHDREQKEDQGFCFNLHLEPKVEDDLKEFLSKHKKFIFKHIISKTHFTSSRIYQLYLQYIPHKLTEIEKSVFLDAYLKIIADVRGTDITEQRKKLEEKLHINQF